MSPWLFNIYMDGVMKVKMGMRRRGVSFLADGVHELERAREGVAVLLNDVWHSAVVKYGCISSRIVWIKFKFSRVKVFVVMGYDTNEGDGEERFWNNMERGLGSLGNRYRLCFLGDLNG